MGQQRSHERPQMLTGFPAYGFDGIAAFCASDPIKRGCR